MSKYLNIKKGSNGWGGPLTIKIKEDKKIISMTGTGIHPLVRHLADLTGCQAVDGFKEGVKDEDILCVVINCAGTLRCGVYPQKRIPTINVNPVGKSGPLEQFITEDIYVSDVTKDTVSIVSSTSQSIREILSVNRENDSDVMIESELTENDTSENQGFMLSLIQKFGGGVGKVTSMFYEAGKESINTVIRTVLPFMAFISILIAIILYTGIGNSIANALKPLAGSLFGLILISVICGIPILSPILGPGAAIAQVIGVLLGTEIGLGHIPPQYALPALFAINVQVGADFVPVGLSMQGAEPDTVKYGTPAFLISRQITGPLAVIVAYLMSFGLF